jgi:hypothetical protein
MTPEAAEKAYWNLVVAANADAGISPEEQKVLNAHAVRLGLDAARAREIQAAALATSPAHLKAPADPLKGLEAMRALLEVAAADGSVSPAELKVARTLAEHLRITRTGLESLVQAALGKSERKRDRAFGKVEATAGSGEEVVYLPPIADPHPRGGLVRSMPFVARLASMTRDCIHCGLEFAARNPYLLVCRVCRRKHELPPEPTPIAQESLFAGICIILLVPSGLLLEQTLGLWSWGFKMAGSSESRSWGRRRGVPVHLYPAIGLTLGLAAGVAWGLTWLLLRAFRRKPSAGSG